MSAAESDDEALLGAAWRRGEEEEAAGAAEEERSEGEEAMRALFLPSGVQEFLVVVVCGDGQISSMHATLAPGICSSAVGVVAQASRCGLPSALPSPAAVWLSAPPSSGRLRLCAVVQSEAVLVADSDRLGPCFKQPMLSGAAFRREEPWPQSLSGEGVRSLATAKCRLSAAWEARTLPCVAGACPIGELFLAAQLAIQL